MTSAQMVDEIVSEASVSVSPGSEAMLPYRVKFLMRGFNQFGPLLIETGDLFGLHRRYEVLTEPHLADTEQQRYALLLLCAYVAATFALLLTTSFLGLRRYQRQRSIGSAGSISNAPPPAHNHPIKSSPLRTATIRAFN